MRWWRSSVRPYDWETDGECDNHSKPRPILERIVEAGPFLMIGPEVVSDPTLDYDEARAADEIQ